jgi:tetratricopeptide (TPR) repeat protein
VKRVLVCLAGLSVLLILARLGIAWRVGQLVHRADSALVIDDDPIRAEQESKLLLSWDKAHPQGLLIQGVALFRQQRFEEAIDWLNRIPHDSGFKQEADQVLSRALLRLHRYGQAETQLRESLTRNPTDQLLQYLLFTLLLETLRIEEAIELYESHLNGTDADVPRLMELLKVQAEPVPARHRQQQIINHCATLDREPNALAALGRTSTLLGDANAAESYFRRAVAAAPEDQRILLWASGFFLSQGQDEQARVILKHVSTGEDSGSTIQAWCDAEHMRLQAEIAAIEGDLQNSLDLVNRSQLSRRTGRAFSLKAELLRRMGRLEDAEEATAELAEFGKADIRLIELHAAVQSQPITEELCVELSNTLRRLGRGRQADAWAKVAVTVHRSATSTLSGGTP